MFCQESVHGESGISTRRPNLAVSNLVDEILIERRSQFHCQSQKDEDETQALEVATDTLRLADSEENLSHSCKSLSQ